jgi:hypothetical protein
MHHAMMPHNQTTTYRFEYRPIRVPVAYFVPRDHSSDVVSLNLTIWNSFDVLGQVHNCKLLMES